MAKRTTSHWPCSVCSERAGGRRPQRIKRVDLPLLPNQLGSIRRQTLLQRLKGARRAMDRPAKGHLQRMPQYLNSNSLKPRQTGKQASERASRASASQAACLMRIRKDLTLPWVEFSTNSISPGRPWQFWILLINHEVVPPKLLLAGLFGLVALSNITSANAAITGCNGGIIGQAL